MGVREVMVEDMVREATKVISRKEAGEKEVGITLEDMGKGKVKARRAKVRARQWG